VAALIQAAQQVLFGLGIYQAGQALQTVGGGEKGELTGAGGGVFARLIKGRSWGKGLEKRPRRRKALTNDDVRLMLTIASSISKKAAETFVAMRTRSR